MDNILVRFFVSVLVTLALSACVTSQKQSAWAQGEMIEVGYIAAWESFDLNARLSGVEPKDYINWLYQNGGHYELAVGVRIDLVAYEHDGGDKFWESTGEQGYLRTKIPASVAVRAGLLCAEVHGYMITHAAKVGEKDGNIFSSCTFRLPDSVRSGRAREGFGIPLILQKGE